MQEHLVPFTLILFFIFYFTFISKIPFSAMIAFDFGYKPSVEPQVN